MCTVELKIYVSDWGGSGESGKSFGVGKLDPGWGRGTKKLQAGKLI